MQPSRNLAYRGLRILDVSQGFAGPYCTAILAASGAEVIKVEPPTGDWARLMGRGKNGHTPMSVVGNVGKRAIGIDATQPRGREVLRRLAESCDVFVQNFRPGVAERLGAGYEDLKIANPKLVYLSISGFGDSGPYVHRAASDSVLQAYTGMMVMNKDERGTPRRIGMLVIDALAGVYAAQLAGTALYERLATGHGSHQKISLLEVCAAFQAIPIVDAALHGNSETSVSVPAGTFATADGYLNLVAIRDAMFFGICRAIGREDWINDTRMATNAGRKEHAVQINQGIAAALKERNSAYWQDLFEKTDVLSSPVLDYQAFMQDPQVKHAEIFLEIDQTALGSLSLPRIPGLGFAPSCDAGSPAVGQHTKEILNDYGYTDHEITDLLLAKAIVVASV